MLEERDIYNKQKVYEEKIEPIINQLKLACNMEHLPTMGHLQMSLRKHLRKYVGNIRR